MFEVKPDGDGMYRLKREGSSELSYTRYYYNYSNRRYKDDIYPIKTRS